MALEEGLPIPVGRKAMPPGDVAARFLVGRDPGRHGGIRCAEVNEAPNERAARGDHLGGEGQRANEGQELTLGVVGALEPSCKSCVEGGQLVLGNRVTCCTLSTSIPSTVITVVGGTTLSWPVATGTPKFSNTVSSVAC